MFNKEEMNTYIKDEVNKHMHFVVNEIERSLSLYPVDIITSFAVKLNEDGDLNLSIDLNDEFEVGDQDVAMVLAHGGAIKLKNGEYKTIPPNIVLTKYLLG